MASNVEIRRFQSYRTDASTGHPVTGFILAGGKSSRMGRDKALLRFKGSYVIEYSIRVLQNFTKDIRIVGNPKKYSILGLPVIPDCIESVGPLGGIYTALKASPNFTNLILACDMPLMRPQFLKLLLEKAKKSDVVVMKFHSGLVEPFCSLYTSKCLTTLEKHLDQQEYRVSDFFDKVRVTYISENDIARLGLTPEIFTNINSPRDFDRLSQLKAY